MASAVDVSYNVSSSDVDSEEDESDPGILQGEQSPEDEKGGDGDTDGSHTSDEEGDEGKKKKKKTISDRGLANVMGKILQKTLEGNKAPILTKAKTDKERTTAQKRKLEDEADADGKKTKTEDDSSDSEDDMNADQKRKLWEEMGRMKPSIMDKNRERTLQRIATKGVVQLFNAVRKQQKLIDDKLTSAGQSETRRDKVMQTMTKGKFLDVLKSSGNPDASNIKDTPQVKEDKSTTEENPSWSVLRDDFMMGAKMKDWDKSDDEDSGPDEGGDAGDGSSSDES